MAEYDSIGSKYDVWKQIPLNLVESYNIQKSVRPYLEGGNTRVIDFACGTGHYSRLLLEWGAATVLGMDISKVMIKGAIERLAATPYASRAEFVEGDGTKPQQYTFEGTTGFKLATGFWFLNYAKDLEDLTAMFRSISMNLVSGGTFVGCVFNPTNDVGAFAKAINDHGSFVTGHQFSYQYELENKQGYTLQASVGPPKDVLTDAERVEFGCYHLKKSVFEEAAHTAGLADKLEWRELEYLDKEWTQKMGIDVEDSRWQFWKQHPSLIILILHKP